MTAIPYHLIFDCYTAISIAISIKISKIGSQSFLYARQVIVHMRSCNKCSFLKKSACDIVWFPCHDVFCIKKSIQRVYERRCTILRDNYQACVNFPLFFCFILLPTSLQLKNAMYFPLISFMIWSPKQQQQPCS